MNDMAELLPSHQTAASLRMSFTPELFEHLSGSDLVPAIPNFSTLSVSSVSYLLLSHSCSLRSLHTGSCRQGLLFLFLFYYFCFNFLKFYSFFENFAQPVLIIFTQPLPDPPHFSIHSILCLFSPFNTSLCCPRFFDA